MSAISCLPVTEPAPKLEQTNMTTRDFRRFQALVQCGAGIRMRAAGPTVYALKESA